MAKIVMQKSRSHGDGSVKYSDILLKKIEHYKNLTIVMWVVKLKNTFKHFCLAK